MCTKQYVTHPSILESVDLLELCWSCESHERPREQVVPAQRRAVARV
jgi:hypothetical protein